ncbi:MAG: hypothetical protein ABI039_01770 [Vicinamibacterales bacterium]
MKRTQLNQVIAWVMLSGSVTAAQAPGQPQPSKTGVVATLSVTGCLVRWAPDSTTNADAAPKPPAGVQFMLTHGQGLAASATSNAPTTQPAPSPDRYLLLESKTIDYAAHLNHRVRIDGTIAPQPSTGASLAQQIEDPSTRETNLPAKAETASYDGNLVDVSTLTMVARSCAP